MSEQMYHTHRDTARESVAQGRPRIFLEIGPGARPTAAESVRRYDNNQIYVGVERNAGDYYFPGMFSAQRKAVAHRADENVILTQGDARHLRFPDGSVHEVFMGNVLNGIDYEDVPRVLEETHRVMDGTGPLIIEMEDTVEPQFVDDLREDLERSGFVADEVLTEGGSDSEKWKELRDTWPAEWPYGHHFMVATKLPGIPQQR